MLAVTYFILNCLLAVKLSRAERETVVFAVGTDDNDALHRYQRSANIFGYRVKILGAGELWFGGDVARFPGGGQKILLLKEALKPYANDQDSIVIFTDSYDVVFLQTQDEFLNKYDSIGHKVVFSAEKFCWPEPSLSSKYPKVNEGECRYLNSGSFVGPAGTIYKILTQKPVENSDDDQLFYTTIFLDPELRQKFDIVLDTRSELFQNLNGALADVRIDYNAYTGYLVNVRTGSKPMLAHGNGPIKHKFNSLTNYLPRTWTPSNGCHHCEEDNIDLKSLSPEMYPTVQIAIFITAPTPFIDDFFEKIYNLDYPRSRIYLTIYCNIEEHYGATLEFNVTRGYDYKSSVVLDEKKYTAELIAKNHAWSICLGIEDCAFVFTIDSMARLTNPDTLKHLVRMNRNIIAPLLTRIGKVWSNFWGDLNEQGFYARSSDYFSIVNRNQTGIWNVPYVSNCYIFSRWTVRQLVDQLPDHDEDAENESGEFPAMKIAGFIRQKNIFQFVDNQLYFGHLVNPDSFNLDHLHPDLWQIFDNPTEWQEKYLHPVYQQYTNRTVSEIEQPCPDVFWVPLLSHRFCRDMIEELELAAQWSTGSNIDPRLEGGYENVPTIDTHMRQINWEEHWMKVLSVYVKPIQRIVFNGYEDEPRARMNFVVRYKPDEQPILAPHHDASTYTLNIALNSPNLDYKGGGARFIRYNCSVTDSRVGWALIHPGRLTHLHEGLRTTHGIRYILVTFVNP